MVRVDDVRLWRLVILASFLISVCVDSPTANPILTASTNEKTSWDMTKHKTNIANSKKSLKLKLYTKPKWGNAAENNVIFAQWTNDAGLSN